MKKQELIDHLKTLKEDKNRFINCIDVDRIINTIKQLDEPQKVTIPKFVADYIEFQKKYNFHVYGAMRTIEDYKDKKVPNWFYDGNIEKFCLAWILGYEVEEKRRYIITLKSSEQKLYYHTEDEDYIFSSYDGVFYSEYHTKTDLEENDMSWVFDCPGIEVQEVE
ncbi:DUF1642 domain-containing protein [Streptococcus oralis]|uniref:DUF1642 domain-containing protein n=1 Tax=Streptococcus oralis TaxID=1303 RepID=UPI002283FE5A|nr:DUF1642 domain-containing protein [Streptococcus oralis]MCY7079854.1 DUF1642 domain-containing protein [Streptococcus oralis]